MWGGLDGPVPRRRELGELRRVRDHMSTPHLHCDENGKKLACLVVLFATDKGARRTERTTSDLYHGKQFITVTPKPSKLVQSIA
jgi:hypothetical protein